MTALSQWFTPPEVARRMAHWVGVPRGDGFHHLLEPCSGQGALIAPLPPGWRVTSVDIDPGLLAPGDNHLVGDFLGPEFDDFIGTFDEFVGRFDITLMNPPYEEGLDGRFLRRAMDRSDRVIALLRTNALHGALRYTEIWCDTNFGLSRLAYLTRRPRFSDSKGSPRHDFVCVELKRGYLSGCTAVEWW